MPTPPDFTAATALAAASLNKVGLWLVNSYTINSASTLHTFSNAFSADFTSYRIVGSGIEGASVAAITLRMGTTDTGYYVSHVYANAASVAATGGNNVGQWDLGVLTVGADASFVCDLHSPQQAKITTYQSQGSDNRTTGGYAYRVSSGFLNNTTQYTSFSVFSGTNIEAGTIRVYGYRN